MVTNLEKSREYVIQCIKLFGNKGGGECKMGTQLNVAFVFVMKYYYFNAEVITHV